MSSLSKCRLLYSLPTCTLPPINKWHKAQSGWNWLRADFQVIFTFSCTLFNAGNLLLRQHHRHHHNHSSNTVINASHIFKTLHLASLTSISSESPPIRWDSKQTWSNFVLSHKCMGFTFRRNWTEITQVRSALPWSQSCSFSSRVYNCNAYSNSYKRTSCIPNVK